VYLEPTRKYNDFSESNEQQVASFDHYISKKRGGGGTKHNTVIAHRQCNSEKGHSPSPEFDEKLQALNIKRGFGEQISDDLIMFRLRPDTFGKNSDALIYLCDLANTIEGDNGRVVRRTISSRINKHTLLIKSLCAIEDVGLRYEALYAVYRNRVATQQSLGDERMDTLLNNVCVTMIKQACRG
jgi:hypothetical protein